VPLNKVVDTEESTLATLRHMAELENRPFENKLRNVTDPRLIEYRQALRDGIAGYNRSLDDMVTRLDLQNNFHNNIRDYANFVTTRYNEYQNAFTGRASSISS
jgi:hypothetical protein